MMGKLKNIKKSILFFKQRLSRGWDDRETYSLDFSLAKLIAPRLRRFKEVLRFKPADLTIEQWHQELDLMIESFEWASSEKRWVESEQQTKYQKGIDLFAKRFFYDLGARKPIALCYGMNGTVIPCAP